MARLTASSTWASSPSVKGETCVKNNIKFTAPLTAITAAVVGVVLNLALFFGYHVLWPKGFESFDVSTGSNLRCRLSTLNHAA